jgi:hypothetical protein
MTIKSKRASKPNKAKSLEAQLIELAPRLAGLLQEPGIYGIALINHDPNQPGMKGLIVSPIVNDPPPSPESQFH